MGDGCAACTKNANAGRRPGVVVLGGVCKNCSLVALKRVLEQASTHVGEGDGRPMWVQDAAVVAANRKAKADDIRKAHAKVVWNMRKLTMALAN